MSVIMAANHKYFDTKCVTSCICQPGSANLRSKEMKAGCFNLMCMRNNKTKNP